MHEQEIQLLQEELHKLKEDTGEVWTAIGNLEISGNQVPLKVTVNTRQKRIEYMEIDRDQASLKTIINF